MNYPVKGLNSWVQMKCLAIDRRCLVSGLPRLYMYALKWSRQALNQMRDKIIVKMGHAFLKKITIEFSWRSSHSSCTLYLLYTFCYQPCTSSVIIFIVFNLFQFADESSSGMEYVDLLRNPEKFTGYAGFSAHRIWNNIYKENCFK